MTHRNSAARRQLHAAAMAMHEALDELEAEDGLNEGRWLLDGTEALLRIAVERFDQIRYCLATYGRSTPPSPIPLTSAIAAADIRRAA